MSKFMIGLLLSIIGIMVYVHRDDISTYIQEVKIEKSEGIKFSNTIEFKNVNNISFVVSYEGEYIIDAETIYLLYELDKINSINNFTKLIDSSLGTSFEKIFKGYTFEEDTLINRKTRTSYFWKIFSDTLYQSLLFNFRFKKFRLNSDIIATDESNSVKEQVKYSIEQKN